MCCFRHELINELGMTQLEGDFRGSDHIEVIQGEPGKSEQDSGDTENSSPRTLNIVEKVRKKKASVVDPEDWNIN